MLFTDQLVTIGTDRDIGHIYAFEKETGDLRWKYRAGRGVPTDIIRVDDSIYGITMDDTLLCLDLETGRENWRFGTDADRQNKSSMDPAPLAVDDLIYFGGRDGVIYAFDAKTGEPIWSTPIGDRVRTSILYHQESLLAGTRDGHLVRVEPTTGVVLGKLSVGKVRGPVIPIPAHNVLIAGRSADSWDGDLIAVALSLQEIVWETLSPEDESWTVARPLILGDWVLTGTRNGQIHAVGIADGEFAWSYSVDPDRDWSEDDGLRVYGRYESTLFVGTIGGMLYAFEIADAPPRHDD